MISELIKKVLNIFNTKEHFEGKKADIPKMILSLLILVGLLVASVFVSKFMWNRFLVPTIAFLNPIKSYFQMIGVLFALQLLK